jgi:glycyl-tRNA synthetase beta chain
MEAEVIMEETLLLEVGTEEIPAGYIRPALEAMAGNLERRMADARIGHGRIRTYGTPRRLSVRVEKVAAKQQSVTTDIIGPPATVGFDANGKPTVAAQKFAEKNEVPIKKLAVKQTEKGTYLYVRKTERGQASRSVLKEIIPQVIPATPFPKKMRWADLDIEFARPIHSIIALLGKNIVPFAFGNLKSGRKTRGHYFQAPAWITIPQADAYIDLLQKAHVIVDIEQRRKLLLREIERVAKKLGGRILPDEELVDINTNLVETPVAGAGRFDEAFLEVPDEVLINAMREHQKYFSVVDDKGKLMPCFIAVNNTRARDMKLVAKGHERVIRARLADAQFFYRGDLEVSNDQRIEKLKGVLFQAQLGTMYDKTQRVTALSEFLSGAVAATAAIPKDQFQKRSRRAAALCKSDLVSQVVGEFPKLQGVMGRVYAGVENEHPDVAAAVEEHYRPVYSGAALPQSMVGAVVAIADKMDSICGCFSIGLVPTGVSDPYALRRQGIGIVQIIKDKGFSLSLQELIRRSLGNFGKKSKKEVDAVAASVYSFFRNRISHMLVEQGHAKDVVAAVTEVSVDDILNVWHRVQALEALKVQADYEPLVAAFKRVGNIIRKSGGLKKIKPVETSLFEDDSEAALYKAFQKVEKEVETAMVRGELDQALRAIASLRSFVDAFFDNVMVMADNKRIRENRLSLLGHIEQLFGRFADFSRIAS